MHLQDALGAIVRRWYVVLVALGAIAAVAYLGVRDVPTQYQSTGQLLVLLPPQSTGPQTPTNPYLNAPGGLTTAASVIATEASTLDTQRELMAAGHRATYTVSVFPGAGPLVVITAKGSDPQDVVDTRDAVMTVVTSELQRIQVENDAPDNQLMYTQASSVDRGAEVLHGSKKRALIGTVGAGGLSTLLLVAVLERLRTTRSSRRQGAADVGSADRDGPDSDVDHPSPVLTR